MDKDKVIPIQPQAIQPQTPAPITTTELLTHIAKRLSEQPEQHIHYHITQVQPSQDDNARTLLQALSGLAIVLLFFFGAISVTVLIWQGVHVATSEVGGQ